jgi:hypothetical protein
VQILGSIFVDHLFAKLGVGDEDFLVASMIERCPKVMMLRELLMNALESASHAKSGRRQVDVTSVQVNGVRKLCIWNTGPGMDAEQLFRMCDIASSIGKQKGLDRNFGMGAKVASLPSNQLGVRYRSCQAGQVHEVTIGKRNGVYGRIPRVDLTTGEAAVVVEVTETAKAEGRLVDQDWTEVVLMGNRPEQDTLADPYERNPPVPRNWLPAAIYNKFFWIDDSIELRMSPETHGMKGVKRLFSLSQRITRRYARHETVRLPDGITIHYLYDPAHPVRENRNASYEDDLLPDTSFCAVINGGEFYDMRRGQQWTLDAPSFGITFGARHFSVLIELADEFPVRADGYRQFLRYLTGVQEHVRLGDFSGLVRANRPKWLVALIDEMSPDVDLSRDVSEQLAQLLASLGVKRMRPKPRKILPPPLLRTEPPPPVSEPIPPPPKEAPETPEAEQVKPPVPPAPPPPQSKPLTPPPAAPELPVEMVLDIEIAPELLLLRDKQEIADRNLTHRAARYYPEAHQLFINMLYPSVARLASLLTAVAPASVDIGRARAEATMLAEQELLLRVGRALVFGLGKRDAAQGWTEADKRTAVSSEVLTIAADDFYTGKAEVTETFLRALRAGSTVDETQLAGEVVTA